jgi:hypothetical protein
LEYADKAVFRVFAQVGAAYDMQITLVIFPRRGTERRGPRTQHDALSVGSGKWRSRCLSFMS